MRFEWGTRTYLMGIVNVTPDSFSGDGILESEKAVAQGIQMEKEGADILDIGGESTRPGSTPLSLEDELARVLPVVEKLAKEVHIPLSIDTYKAEVARQAIAAGASMINDVWGGKMDDEPEGARSARGSSRRLRRTIDIAAEANVPIILMHNRSKPKNAEQSAKTAEDGSPDSTRHVEFREKLGGRYVGMEYGDLLADIKKELQESVDSALAAGVAKENIIIDPGIGFGKTVEQNLELLYRMRELRDLGYPVLAGPSRKSFVGFTLNLPPDERLEGTLAAVALCIERGADIVRVHDVKEANRAVRFTDAVVRRSQVLPQI